MIDKDLLVALGWSDELISEVTRISHTIKSGFFNEIKGPVLNQRTSSGTMLHIDEPHRNTSYGFLFMDK